jgi:hypothetical protein
MPGQFPDESGDNFGVGPIDYLDRTPSPQPDGGYPGLGGTPAPSIEHPARRSRRRPRNTGGNDIPDVVSVPHWDDADGGAWDRVIIGPYEFSGTVKVSGSGPKLQLDKRKHPGADGATIVSKGYELAEFTLTLRVWTQQHLEDFSELMGRVHPARNASARNALDVYHPALALLSITKMVVVSPGLLVPGDVPGLMECSLACMEYRPPSASRNATHRATVDNNSPSTLALDQPFDTQSDDPNTTPPPSTTNAEP